MSITVRVVALGRDNGVQVAAIKTFDIEPREGETVQDAAQRTQAEVREDIRDFLRDGVKVVESNMVVSVGVVR